jgi:hypothetical protein
MIWVPEGQGEQCRIFTRDLSQESRLSLKTARGSVAAFKDESGHFWFPRWSDQAALNRWKAPLPALAQLMGWTKDGISLWSSPEAGATTFSWVDLQGEGIGKGTLPIAEKMNLALALGPGRDIFYGLVETGGFAIQTLSSE